MTTKETGGPAFPLANSHKELNATNWEDANGMTLRDYFAAKAMLGIFASGAIYQSDSVERISKDAYELADAMIEARKS